MIRSPAGPGTIGQLWYRSRALVTCARRQIKAIKAAAVELAGQETLKKFNIESINEIHDQWCRDNGYPVLKPTSARARVRKTSRHKLRAQASSRNPQAPRS